MASKRFTNESPRSEQSSTVSVVVTVFNEIGSLDRLIASLADQSRRPDEIVIADGGSTDGTWERLEGLAGSADPQLTAISLPGANIAAGRNAAIAAARGPIIACTDAGVRLVDTWLTEITAPLERGAKVVAGFFAPDPRTAFETALGATTLPERRDIDPATFLPSSRSIAFLKDVWAAAGGYPEWLDYCEDLVFDIRARAVAGPAAFAPRAVAWFRPRPTLAAFTRQYYLYARGDGKADLWAGRHAMRYVTYLVAMPALAAVAMRIHPVGWLALLAGLAMMVRTPYRRLLRQWAALSTVEKLRAALWLPMIRVTGDVGKMAGYPVGVWWRWRRRPPEWRPNGSAGRW